MIDSEFTREMLSYSLYSVPFGRMMPRGNESYARLARDMNDAFGNFTCDERIHAQPDSLFEIILCRAGTPCDTL